VFSTPLCGFRNDSPIKTQTINEKKFCSQQNNYVQLAASMHALCCRSGLKTENAQNKKEYCKPILSLSRFVQKTGSELRRL